MQEGSGTKPDANGRPVLSGELTPRVQTLHELEAQPCDVPQGLWGRWLEPSEMTSVAARAGRGKTTLTPNVIAHGAKGGGYLGLRFARPLQFLLSSGEGAAPFFRRAMIAVADALS